MFIGTRSKANTNRKVLVEGCVLDKLENTNLSNDCYNIIIIKNGNLTVRINEKNLYVVAPAIICLDEIKEFQILSNNSYNVLLIRFDPRFLNINMHPNTIRSGKYYDLCQQHAFFQLSPFLATEAEKTCMQINNDTLEKVEYSFNHLLKNLEEQADWYWSCRARSYFIDIINTVERIFHNYYIEDHFNEYTQIAISDEFALLVTYINNHLNEKLTLNMLYSHFRINKNQIENLFKQILHTTFYEYLRNRRYEEATYYLRFTELDCAQIAYRIGLSSGQNFCKFFKQMSGTTPNGFRKQMVYNRKMDPTLLKFINHNF